MTRRAHLVVWCAVAVVLAGCDGWYFRRIDVTGADAASFAPGGVSTQAVFSALRDYAARAKLRCPSEDKLPFECSRRPIRVWVQQLEHGVAVCYAADGAAFERRKFEHRMDELQSVLAERFGMRSVMPSQAGCAASAAR